MKRHFKWSLERLAVAERELFFNMFCALANFIILPCLGIFAVNVNCYYNLWNPQVIVNSQYEYKTCNYAQQFKYKNDVECFSNSTGTSPTSYLPPFLYNFQCSSMLLTNYSPVFVFSSILSSILLPSFSLIHSRISKTWIEQTFPMIPECVRNLLACPQSLLEILESMGINAKSDDEGRNAVVITELCRKHLGVGEFFVRWYRNCALILIVGIELNLITS